MATYVVLGSFTEQGARNIKDTGKRADGVRDLAKKYGVTAREFFWTMGAHDLTVIFDAPDDASITALMMEIARAGNVRTQTMRAFSRTELDQVTGRIG